MIRRLKEDIRKIQGGFPERVVGKIELKDLDNASPELELPRLLDQYKLLMNKLCYSNQRAKDMPFIWSLSIYKTLTFLNTGI